MHSHIAEFLHLSHFLSSERYEAFFPTGAQRPGWIGRIGANIPIAIFCNAAAICKGPVLAAIKPSAAAMKLINPVSDICPVKSVISV